MNNRMFSRKETKGFKKACETNRDECMLEDPKDLDGAMHIEYIRQALEDEYTRGMVVGAAAFGVGVIAAKVVGFYKDVRNLQKKSK